MGQTIGKEKFLKEKVVEHLPSLYMYEQEYHRFIDNFVYNHTKFACVEYYQRKKYLCEEEEIGGGLQFPKSMDITYDPPLSLCSNI